MDWQLHGTTWLRGAGRALAGLLLAASLTTGVQAEVFTDDFETDHDFAADGVAGTGWDGVTSFGDDVDATINDLDTTTFDGELTINSSNTNNADLATLFRTVPANTNFRATVEISRNSDLPGNTMATQDEGAVSFHTTGITARAATEPNGPDWVGALGFRQFFSDFLQRSLNDGAESNIDEDISAPGPDGINLSERVPDYLRMDRRGDEFIAYWSYDGKSWTQFDGWREGQGDLVERPDLAGRELQVGLSQALFTDSSDVNAVYDDFSLQTGDDIQTTQLTIDRATGEATFTNGTDNTMEVIEYEIESESGAIDSAAWDSIAETGDADSGGSVTGDKWFELAGTGKTELAESSLGTWQIDPGESLSLGEIWRKGPDQFADLEMVLQMADGDTHDVPIVFTGKPFSQADLNVDGAVDAADWLTLRDNTFTDAAEGLDALGAFKVGDLNDDELINEEDFVLFKNRFNAAKGSEQAFARMLASIPEPSSLAALVIGGLALSRRRRATLR